ncbi:putative metal-binding protein, possibly nucleic-acid binding protein [Synechococcus sp. PCC 7502]|uniref:YceD family protein n=1 Tax=Synechococcus sp. PCC 7502 TaxID=1173263 RepID=UPI00029FD0B8|nr:DUF177 domain-containing protein [Synechococcus sp. PCC 7502]AFY74380.1 putative metal-binding protein, possibly nucleic-acid binding protein [Synechococcus sp. PCC 7502]
MEKIYIPQVAKAVDATEVISVNEFIKDLDTLTPVQGVVKVKHQGSFLEVKAEASAIMTLTCDRTLNQFNHRLAINTSELIWLEEPSSGNKYASEQEIELDDLVETLPPKGYFDVGVWLYEQLSLAIPFQKIAPDAPELSQILEQARAKDQIVDKRWLVLGKLQIDS